MARSLGVNPEDSPDGLGRDCWAESFRISSRLHRDVLIRESDLDVLEIFHSSSWILLSHAMLRIERSRKSDEFGVSFLNSSAIEAKVRNRRADRCEIAGWKENHHFPL